MTKRTFQQFIVFFFVLLAACGDSGSPTDNNGSTDTPNSNTPISNSLQIVINDMTLAHEGELHGVPSNWALAQHPVYYAANSHPLPAVTGWGELFEAADADNSVDAPNTKVQIADFKTYYFSKSDHKWHLIQSPSRVDGAWYNESHSNEGSISADIRNEDPGISVTAGNGHDFHFYTTRVSIPQSDVGGIFTTFRARLILKNASGSDDRSKARYLACAGGDFYPSVNYVWDSGNPPLLVGYGRFKYVTNGWQSFNMCELKDLGGNKADDSAADAAAVNLIKTYPPPVD
jgi:hypothetical protein